MAGQREGIVRWGVVPAPIRDNGAHRAHATWPCLPPLCLLAPNAYSSSPALAAKAACSRMVYINIYIHLYVYICICYICVYICIRIYSIHLAPVCNWVPSRSARINPTPAKQQGPHHGST